MTLCILIIRYNALQRVQGSLFSVFKSRIQSIILVMKIQRNFALYYLSWNRNFSIHNAELLFSMSSKIKYNFHVKMGSLLHLYCILLSYSIWCSKFIVKFYYVFVLCFIVHNVQLKIFFRDMLLKMYRKRHLINIFSRMNAKICFIIYLNA